MPMQIVRNLGLLLAPIAFVFITFFTANTPVHALIKGWTPPSQEASSQEEMIDRSQAIGMIPLEENNGLDNEDVALNQGNKNNPEFEDDQVFPFISGFDSYK